MTLTLTPALSLAAIILIIPAVGAIGYELGRSRISDEDD